MGTQIIYSGVDITEDVQITSCSLTDVGGGEQDYLTVSFANGSKIWNEWTPKRDDAVTIKNGYTSSGKMYVNDLLDSNGGFTLILMPTKTNAKQRKTQIWRDVKLSEIISDVGKNTGLNVQKIDFKDYTYKALTQNNETEVSFLNRRCALEGYSVKIYDGNLVVFDEKVLKAKEHSGIITPEDCMFREFDDGGLLLHSVTVRHYDVLKKSFITYTAEDINISGGSKTFRLRVDNQAQAERFSKNILYNANKYAVCGSLKIKYADVFASGSVIMLKGFKGYSGKYYIYKNIFDMLNDECMMQVCRIEE